MSKTRFVAARFEPEQQRKLILLSVRAGDPGNMSAGLRYAVDRVAEITQCDDASATGEYQTKKGEAHHA